jgi:mannose-6-phosphate isomerase-like protein (cupin superfamily)
VNANCVEQIADQPIHLPARAKHRFEQLLTVQLVQILFQQQVSAGDDQVERIAEVVSDDSENLLTCVRQ